MLPVAVAIGGLAAVDRARQNRQAATPVHHHHYRDAPLGDAPLGDAPLGIGAPSRALLLGGFAVSAAVALMATIRR